MPLLRLRSSAAAGALAALLLGCSSEQPAGENPQANAAAAQRRGELLSLACQACHALTAEGGPDIGPSLSGVFGRRSASLDDFAYSEALRATDFLWTAERLDAWLRAPLEFLPGTTMVFAGYDDAADRRLLIDWLQQATAVETVPGTGGQAPAEPAQ